MPLDELAISSSYRIASSKIVWQCFDDELVVINLESGKYYSINSSGSALWNLMEAGWSPAATLSRVLDGVAPEEGRSHVLAFWAKLIEEDLVIPAAPGEPRKDVPVPSPWIHPSIAVFRDMQELFQLDPIHDVDEAGWPSRPPEAS
jgi:hypothetical protein